MDEAALERVKQRIADAAAGRPEPAVLEAALERSREQIASLAEAAAELEASMPERIESSVRDGLRSEVLPVARQVAEIRGLMNQVIRAGVKTKVLMLSATPVNNRFNDLRNQLALAYEGQSDILSEKLNTTSSVEEIFRRAQAADQISAIVNCWLSQSESSP